VGYVIGAYSRHALHRRKIAQAAPPAPATKPPQKRNRNGSSKT